MALILSLETSAKLCSVAIHRKGELVATTKTAIEKSHSEQLMSMIDQLLKNNELKANDLDAIAISAGPGSYTGLRVGTSTAKGMCFALDIPLISLSTPEISAFPYFGTASSGRIFSLIDARREEVFATIYAMDSSIILETQPVILTEENLTNYLHPTTNYIIGDGAFKIKKHVDLENFSILPFSAPSAEHMGIAANKKFESKHFENLAYFEPFYLKSANITKSKKDPLYGRNRKQSTAK